MAPNGTVYVVFMQQTAHHQFPVVDTSFDHGRSFPQVSRLIPQQPGNFGGRPFIAAATNGTVYLTWDYGPSAAAVSYICTPRGGGCSFKTGDLNIVPQKSNDFGLTWGPMTVVSPGFPDGGATWSARVRVGPRWASMAPREWWIDGSIARDSGGYLYVTWDSQRHGHDVAWLSFSTNGGTAWSSPVQVSRDRANVPHIVEVAGGFRGTAYVAWLSDNTACGYALRARAYSVFSGRLSRPVRSPGRCGRRHVWPGGMFGITALPPADLANGTWQVALSRGSAVARRPRPPSEILSTVASYSGPG